MPKYRLGKITFGNPLAREHWVVQSELKLLKYTLTLCNEPVVKECLKASISSLQKASNRMHKILLKEKYYTA